MQLNKHLKVSPKNQIFLTFCALRACLQFLECPILKLTCGGERLKAKSPNSPHPKYRPRPNTCETDEYSTRSSKCAVRACGPGSSPCVRVHHAARPGRAAHPPRISGNNLLLQSLIIAAGCGRAPARPPSSLMAFSARGG